MSNAVKDERVQKTSPITNLLRRPEFGALMGALAIFVLFSVVDTTGNFGLPGGIAGWTDIAAPIGIVAVFVALLMIGGEFDLSTGIMVGSTGLLAGLIVTQLGLDIWTTIAIVTRLLTTTRLLLYLPARLIFLALTSRFQFFGGSSLLSWQLGF